jgi:hypothetical protein
MGVKKKNVNRVLIEKLAKGKRLHARSRHKQMLK